MFRRITSLFLTLIMVISLLPVQVLAGEVDDLSQTEQEATVSETEQPEETVSEESTSEESIPEESVPEESVPEESVPAESLSEESLPEEMIPEESIAEETVTEDPEEMVPVVVEWETGDADELLNGYLMTLFYPERIETPYSCYIREQLTAVQKYVYDQAAQVADDIVARRRDTVDMKIRFDAIGVDVSSFTEEQLNKTMYAFSQDHPYETFWYGGYAYRYVDNVNELWLWLMPRAQYRPADFHYYDNPTIQIDVLEQAIIALDNVNDVLDAFDHYPDYYKLTAYADKICELVEYDYDAIGNWDVDINPATLVNIFDGDPSTGVVCQGYAEGFQYLCDRSEFRGDVKCYYAGNGQPSINHAWNIVRVEGKGYLMDVTHCDVGSYAVRGEKFMGYSSNSVSEGYVFDRFHYWYDDEMLGIWGSGPDSILQLASTPLDPEDFLVPMTQTEFEAELSSCSGSYYLEKSVMLSSSLSLDGIHLTIGPGGKLIVAADTLLRIPANASLRLEYGAILDIRKDGTVACFGDYSAHNMSTLLNNGKFYADAVGLLAWYADHCEDMTAREIREVLQTIGAETILAALQEDPSCGQSIAVLEEKAGVVADVMVLDTVVGFPEHPVTVAGAGFNTSDGSGNPIRLELGILNGQSDSVEAGFSLVLKNTRDGMKLDFPVQVTMKLPNSLTVPGLFLEHRRADGSWERVAYSCPDDVTIQFATGVLGDFRLFYLTSGSCGTAAVWNFDRATGELTISGTGSMQDYQNLEDRPWHGLAYAGRIKSITVEEGISRIGKSSFYQVRSAENLTLPGTLTEIGESAFLQCQSICELTLPENLKVIGTHAFYNSNGLSTVVFPAGLTTIGDGAFRYCFGLKHIVFRGDAPQFVKNRSSAWVNFQEVVADVYYPAGNSTWEGENVRQNYGGTLTWKTGCDGGHTIVTIPGKAATCTAAGLTTGEYCSVCGAVLAVQKTIPARGHYTVADPSVAPTCTEPGMTGGSHCGNCGEVFVAQRVIDKLGHNAVKDAASAPSCTKPGLTEGTHCSRCGVILTAQIEIPLLGHIEVTDEKVEPTCTEDGLTEGIHCDRCGETLTAQILIPALGHDAITDAGVDATCMESGLTEGAHCGRCGDILTAQVTVPALGHQQITDIGVEPTCTEEGLTEGAHCDRCGEVLTPQTAVPATGHSFELQGEKILCTACGAELRLGILQEYAILEVGETLTLDVYPSELAEKVDWSVENEAGVVAMDGNVLTAAKPGTAHVVATVIQDEITLTARCRVDVAESMEVDGVQLSTTKATTELYSTDYTDLEILLKLPQNYTLSEQEDVQDNGIAIDSVRFTDEAMANLFQISVLDDRRVQIVPTEEAVERAQANAKSVASKYTGTITVTVHGEEYETDKLTLTVKQTKPKVKATVAAFNSFYTGQSQRIVITGGTPTAIYENDAKNTAKTTAIPTWLDLENDVLILNQSAPKKSTSCKAYLLIDTEEWRIPAAVTLSVKNSYKVPGVKLSASSVTVSNLQKSASVELQLLCTNKADTLSNLNITNITAPEGYTVENFNDETGTFTLKAANGFKSGKLTLKVTYGDITKSLALTVKAQAVKLKLSASKVTLNKDLKDTASVTVSTVTGGYEVTNPVLTFDDTKLDARYSDGKLTVSLEDGAEYGKTYPVTVCAYEGAPTVKLSVAVPKQIAAVKSTIKATGTLDVIRESTAITVKPTYTNAAYVNVDKDAVLKIYTSADKYKEVFAEVKAENGIFVIDNSVISDHTLKYKAQLETKVYDDREPVKSAMISLSIKMGTAKLKVNAENPNLFVWDKYSRVAFRVAATDNTLNALSAVKIKEAKYQELFEIHSYGNNAYAIGFAGNEVGSSLMGKKAPKSVTVTLQLFLEGNGGAKANAEVKLKLNLVSAPLTTSVSIALGDADVTGQVLDLYAEDELKLTGIPRPEDAVGVFAWSSSDPSVAAADPSGGRVQANKLGTATITGTAIDGSGKQASVRVKVNPPETGFTLNLTGDWDSVTAEGYQEKLTDVFHTVYPRIYARVAPENQTKTVTVTADSTYEGVAYTSGSKIVISANYANSNPSDLGFFAHELTHVAQSYGNKLNYGGDAWWTENLANYARFRYYAWASPETVKVYTKDDAALRDWGYKSYGSCEWFFAYLDDRYPTVEDSSGKRIPGLIDSLNDLVQQNQGEQLSDDPRDTDSRFNRVVQEITGFDCIESLRVRFAEELQANTWIFTGFGPYRDNFLTENLPGVKNPDYPAMTEPVHGQNTAAPVSAITTGNNLCTGAAVMAVSGQVSEKEGAQLLIDGNHRTKWCCTASTATDHRYNLDGTKQWIVLDLGEEKEFNTYTVMNTKTVEPSYGNMTQWELLASGDGESWTSVDYQPDCDRDSASFRVGAQRARYIMLRIYNPDDSQAGTIRLYEFMLYQQ